MTNTAEPNDAISKRPPAPGILFEPLGWMRDWLAAVIDTEPDLLREICFLSRQRMHLMALAVTHLGGSEGLELPRFLLRGSIREILDRSLGRRPNGLKRALSRLQSDVLSPEGYRRLIQLLDDPISFKFLAHSREIDERKIELLSNIPAELRPMLVPLIHSLGRKGLLGFFEGLHFLAARGAAPNFDALVAECKGLHQPLQLSAYVKGLVESLPLPAEMPPPRIGLARRLDSPSEVRDLARRWRNCIERIYLSDIDDGKCALYLWENEEAPAVCLIVRYGRLGWFFDEAKGPGNAELGPRHRAFLQQAFSDAGIPSDLVACAIRVVINSADEPLGEQQGIPF
jgi:hypothetical protein